MEQNNNRQMAETSIKRNFTYQMIYEILIIILPFITSPYIARVIGAEGLGIYSYSYSIAYYFVLFAMLGLKNYGNRAIARTRDDQQQMNKTFSDILTLHMLIAVICTVVYVGYIFLLDEKIYAVIQVFYVTSALFDISWFYFGIEKFRTTVTRSCVVRIVNVICVFVFVHSTDDLWIYCLIMALSQLASQLALWIPLRKFVRIVRPKWADMKVHVKPMLILFIPAVAVSLYKYMDKIMLGLISSNVQLGFYENAEKVNNIPVTIISSFGTVMLPRMSNMAAKGKKKESERYTAISMQLVMCLALALAFGLAAVATVFAPVFWGTEFIPSGTLIMGLSITIPFISFANVIRTQYLIPNQKDRQYVASVIWGAVVNLVINLILISRLGAVGAMIGTIAAEITVCVYQAIVVRKQMPIWSYIKSFAYFILIGALMFVVVYVFGNVMGTRILTLILQIVIGIVIYSVLSLIYFVRKRNTVVLNMVNGIFKRVKLPVRFGEKH